MPGMTRRRLLVTGLGGAAVVGAGALIEVGPRTLAKELKHRFFPGPPARIPDVPEGVVHLEQVYSRARGRTIDLFTAVPHGFGDGAGLPVLLVLHGATARPRDFQPFGLPRFLTAAVRAGTPPFVLAGADGGLLEWEPGHAQGDNPQAMVLDEMPEWLRRRGFDVRRRAAWGWSMGGYGVIRLAQTRPDWLRAVAAFSPAVSPGDRAFADAARLSGQRLGIWCGRQDPLFGDVQQFVAALPQRPAIVTYRDGAHTRAFWDSVTLPAFAFAGGALAA